MPSALLIPVLTEILDSASQPRPSLGQTARCQMAPDRRRASPTSEEARPAALCLRLGEPAVH
jgi:hypothetical protein